MLERERLVEVIVELAEAVSTAQAELTYLGSEEFEMPAPDGVLAALEEGMAARKVIEWILGRQGTSPEMAAAVNRRLDEERGFASASVDLPRVPVSEDTLAQLDATHETLRRARLFDGALDVGLRDAVLRADLAGC